MPRWFARAFTALGLIAVAASAQAGTITYNGYSVVDNQTVALNDSALGVANETGGSGEILLLNTDAKGDAIATFCIDILHQLLWSGTFSTGSVLGGQFGADVNALISHVLPLIGSDANASSALQVAIWRDEYGPGLTVTAPSAVATRADTYLANLASHAWLADPSMQVAVLAGDGRNQDQAELTPVSEPASLVVLAAGLLGLGFARRRRAAAGGMRAGEIT